MTHALTTREHRPVLRRSSSSHDLRASAARHSRSYNAQNAVVFIVDDDTSMREGLIDLLESVCFQAKAFSSASELSSLELPDVASCFVVDVRMPGLSGLEFQARLAEAHIRIPIILMTGHADIPMAVKAMKAGAVDFLTKPFRQQEMLDAVAKAIEIDDIRLDSDRLATEAFTRYESLSQRERDVRKLGTAVLMNKQAAARIGVAEVTVKSNRAKVMQKMGARSLADLVRIAELLQLAAIDRVGLATSSVPELMAWPRDRATQSC